MRLCTCHFRWFSVDSTFCVWVLWDLLTSNVWPSDGASCRHVTLYEQHFHHVWRRSSCFNFARTCDFSIMTFRHDDIASNTYQETMCTRLNFLSSYIIELQAHTGHMDEQTDRVQCITRPRSWRPLNNYYYYFYTVVIIFYKASIVCTALIALNWKILVN